MYVFLHESLHKDWETQMGRRKENDRMIFKGETSCEKCFHKRVCCMKNQQDFLDAKRGIEKLGETISDIFEASVRCKEFREDVAVRTPFRK